jgi:hypothetical protein
VLQEFQGNRLKLSPEKKLLFAKKMHFLQFLETPRVSTDPEKLEAAQCWQRPRDKLPCIMHQEEVHLPTSPSR